MISDASPVVKNELSVEPPVIPSDSILSYAFHNRDEVLINEKKTSLAELRYGMTKLQNKPLLNLQASGGAKNGYIPDLDKIHTKLCCWSRTQDSYFRRNEKQI